MTSKKRKRIIIIGILILAILSYSAGYKLGTYLGNDLSIKIEENNKEWNYYK